MSDESLSDADREIIGALTEFWDSLMRGRDLMSYKATRKAWRESDRVLLIPGNSTQELWVVVNPDAGIEGIGETKEEALFRALPLSRDDDEPLLDCLTESQKGYGWKLLKLVISSVEVH